MARKKRRCVRTKSGRPSRAYKNPEVRDNGTPQVQAKRKAMVGAEVDPALACSVPGILFAHGYLDREQRDMAFTYGKICDAVYKPLWPPNGPGGQISDQHLAKLQARLRALEARVTADQRDVVRNVASNAWPNWFDAKRLKLKELPEDIRQHALLITGLDAMLERRPDAKAA